MAETDGSIHARMAAVLADLPAIGKNSTAPSNMGGYSFRGIEDILSALKPVLAAHGVFVVPRTIERIESGRSLSSNKTMFVVDVHVEFTFYGPAGDTVTTSTWGEGTDMGDKATQKAYTSAFKSMLSQVFCVADEQTDSERHNVPESSARRNRPPEDDRPPEDEGFWGGWPTEKEMQDAHASLPKVTTDAGKLAVREWLTSRGHRWVPRDEFDEFAALVTRLAAGACEYCGEMPCECQPAHSV